MNKPKIEDFVNDKMHLFVSYAEALGKWGDEKAKQSDKFESMTITLAKSIDDLQKQVEELNKLIQITYKFDNASIDFVRCQIMGGSVSVCMGYEDPDKVKEIWKLLNKSK